MLCPLLPYSCFPPIIFCLQQRRCRFAGCSIDDRVWAQQVSDGQCARSLKSALFFGDWFDLLRARESCFWISARLASHGDLLGDQRLVSRHGLAAVRQDDGALVFGSRTRHQNGRVECICCCKCDSAALFAIGFLIYGPVMLIGVAAVDLVPKKLWELQPG